MKLNYRFIQLLLSIALLVTSCTNKKATVEFVPPSSKEIYDVVNTLVKDEKLDSPVYKKKTFIMARLDKRKVNFEGRWGKYANYIDLIAQKELFSKNDSVFFVYQNSILSTFTLTHTPFKVFPKEDLKSKKIDPWYQPVIEITIPVFSLDHNKAYVEVDFNIADAGHGEAYFMVKENNQWRVKLKYQTWIA